MKPIFIFLILWVISLLSIGQSCPADYLTMVSSPNLRQWNPAFTYSILSEEFNSFNTTVWGVRAGCVRNVDVEAQHYKNSPNNVSVSDSTLKLTARKETTWDWVYHQTGDPTWGQRSYTSGEIYTLAKTFGFGEFTIRCKFPVGAGSWAAFWMFGGFGLAGEANEIDFFEQYREDTSGGEIDNVIHWYYGGGGGCGPSKTSNEPTNVNNWHIYRCRWTPYEIKFYIDDLNNPVHKWSRYEIQSPQQYLGIENIVGGTNYVCNATYPMYPGEIILNYAIYNGVSIDDTKLPQPFEIDYIKIRKFFLVPEITCPTIICSTGTASIEVDPAVTSITWALTPSNLFSGATTGSGTTANITASSCCQGKGKITYTYTIGNYGETFTTEKDIWIKGPDVTEVLFDVFRSDGVRATKVGSTFLLCPNTNYHIYLLNSSPVPLSNYNWIVPSA